MLGGVLVKLSLYKYIEIMDERNEVIHPWMGGPIHGSKTPLATIGRSANDGKDPRPRQIPSVIHGIALHSWIVMIHEWRATCTRAHYEACNLALDFSFVFPYK